jgi:hypothetical protein
MNLRKYGIKQPSSVSKVLFQHLLEVLTETMKTVVKKVGLQAKCGIQDLRKMNQE